MDDVVNTASQALTAVAVLASAVIYGTDVFAAVALRPALGRVDDRGLTAVMGHVHGYADRRLPVPSAVGLVATVAATVTSALAGRTGAAIACGAALAAFVAWLAVYGRISAPVNRRLTAAAHGGDTPAEARDLQHRWDSVITARAVLQLVGVAALCAALILP